MPQMVFAGAAVGQSGGESDEHRLRSRAARRIRIRRVRPQGRRSWCRRRRSRRRSRGVRAGRCLPLRGPRPGRRRRSGPVRSRWRAGRSAPGRRTSCRRCRSPCSGWASILAPCGGTVPQEWNSGSISGPSSVGASTAGSRFSRSSRRMSRSGRKPVQGTTTSASRVRPSTEDTVTAPSDAARDAMPKPVCSSMVPARRGARSRAPSWPRAASPSASPPP